VKRNTLLHPAYHGRGLGQLMTQHANAIADEAGQPTFVLARPNAYRMLENTGFQLGETVYFETTKFGWREDAVVRAYRREAGTSYCG
jgi:GNAT superfamily N-acetyltransferase